MTKVFIDGSAGTTGLRIHERLQSRSDLELILLPDALRKDDNARKEALHTADIAFLCLPDAAAVQAVALAEGSKVAIIDTSTAHRTADGWVYGFAELPGKREALPGAKRVANPGCHASGFVALMEPLVREGLIAADLGLQSFSLTGYSGGGKGMIADYESEGRNPLLDAPRQYGLTQQHKHLKEMVKLCGLATTPVFCPIVADYYSGMEVVVPLFTKDLKGTPEDVKQLYKACYHTAMVHYEEAADESGFLSANALSGRDDMEISVCGKEDRILLVARFDNLGKGASGAAIQNMNIMLGLDETTGLNV